MRHVISVLVENKFGVLARIAGLFSGRGYNIESLTVNSTEKPEVSLMTIVTYGDDKIIEQIIKQLRKLINILKVRDLTSYNHLERELILIKISSSHKTRTDLFNIINTFRGKVIDLNADSMIVEITGDNDKLAAFIEVIEPYGIVEMIRSGSLAIGRGSKLTSEMEKIKSSTNR